MFRHHHPADHVLLLASEQELEPLEQTHVDAHLASCDDCRRRRDLMQTALADFATEASTDLDAVTGDVDDARRRLQQAMRSTPQVSAPLWIWQVPRTLQSVQMPLVLAVLLLAIGFSWSTVHSSSADSESADVTVALPVERLTPGAVADLDARALCSGERPSRIVPATVKFQVLADYGMQGVAEGTYELDALITPDLGGTTERANLWPQKYSATWNAHVKDALENLLAARVCQNQLPLATAQRALAGDWVSAYKRYFDTNAPLPEHVAASDLDEDLQVDSRIARARRSQWLPASMLLVACTACRD